MSPKMKFPGTLALLVILANGARIGLAGEAQSEKVLNLGIAENMFDGMPKAFRTATSRPFLNLMEQSVGFKGKLHFPANPMTLAAELEEGKIDLGILQGDELARAQARYSDITPILLAVQRYPVRIVCVVRTDCRASNVGDLAGQPISMSPYRRPQCELFLHKEEQNRVKGKKELNPATAFDALFEVIEGKSSCAVVHEATLKAFQDINPGKSKNLRILCKSGQFPETCIAMKKNRLDPQLVNKLCETLLNVENIRGGKELLTMWKLKGFEKVPANFEKSLEAFREQFPELSKNETATRDVRRVSDRP